MNGSLSHAAKNQPGTGKGKGEGGERGRSGSSIDSLGLIRTRIYIPRYIHTSYIHFFLRRTEHLRRVLSSAIYQATYDIMEPPRPPTPPSAPPLLNHQYPIPKTGGRRPIVWALHHPSIMAKYVTYIYLYNYVRHTCSFST